MGKNQRKLWGEEWKEKCLLDRFDEDKALVFFYNTNVFCLTGKGTYEGIYLKKYKLYCKNLSIEKFILVGFYFLVGKRWEWD